MYALNDDWENIHLQDESYLETAYWNEYETVMRDDLCV
jgi:hypothetical protein